MKVDQNQIGLTTTLPDFIIHCDWSIHPQKRSLVKADLQPNGRYLLKFPKAVRGDLVDLIDPYEQGGRQSAEHSLFFGIDVPLGVPLAYARQAKINDFLALLPQLGHNRWADFYTPAETVDEISHFRPFYPQRPGNSRQQHLIDKLNVTSMNALRRQCDLPTADRRAAAPLFWTMGAQQVGKAAIAFWRDVLTPAIRLNRFDVRVWPFSGDLADLLEHAIQNKRQTIVAEAYPAEFYTHFGIHFPRHPGRKSGKRVQADRRAHAATILDCADQLGADVEPTFRFLIEDGFGPSPTGEDQFDAAIGALGMLNIVRGRRSAGTPINNDVRQIEGSILGIQVPTEQDSLLQ